MKYPRLCRGYLFVAFSGFLATWLQRSCRCFSILPAFYPQIPRSEEQVQPSGNHAFITLISSPLYDRCGDLQPVLRSDATARMGCAQYGIRSALYLCRHGHKPRYTTEGLQELLKKVVSSLRAEGVADSVINVLLNCALIAVNTATSKGSNKLSMSSMNISQM